MRQTDDSPVNLVSPRKVEFLEIDEAFSAVFRYTLSNGEKIGVRLKETALTSEMYINPECYNRFGKCFCLVYDVSLGKGGCEAIVESLHSVMKTQSQHGNQSNEILVARTSVDWHCPPSPLGIDDVIKDAAKFHLQKHRAPISKINFGLSKVMKRLKADRGLIP